MLVVELMDIFLLITTRKHRYWPHSYLQIAIEIWTF